MVQVADGDKLSTVYSVGFLRLQTHSAHRIVYVHDGGELSSVYAVVVVVVFARHSAREVV